jgi:hypothetical protein
MAWEPTVPDFQQFEMRSGRLSTTAGERRPRNLFAFLSPAIESSAARPRRYCPSGASHQRVRDWLRKESRGAALVDLGGERSSAALGAGRIELKHSAYERYQKLWERVTC